MKYLVTGAAGFIGSKVSEMLLSRGDEVVGVDNLNDYYDVRLKWHRLGFLKDLPGFRFLTMDIEDRQGVNSLFAAERFDAVINLAARAGVRYSIENPFVYLTTNTAGTLNILDGMRKRDVRKLVLASSSSLYAGQPTPFHEDLPVSTPISPYAATKKAAEDLAYTYHYLHGLDVTVLRYFTVYGPAGRPDMSPFKFIRFIDEGKPIEVYGDGTQSRDFTYVDDIVRGTVEAIKPLGFEIINLGGGQTPIILNSFIELVESKMQKKAIVVRKPFNRADMKETRADIAKAKRLLQWEPATKIEDGVCKTVEWYLANRSWLVKLSV